MSDTSEHASIDTDSDHFYDCPEEVDEEGYNTTNNTSIELNDKNKDLMVDNNHFTQKIEEIQLDKELEDFTTNKDKVSGIVESHFPPSPRRSKKKTTPPEIIFEEVPDLQQRKSGRKKKGNRCHQVPKKELQEKLQKFQLNLKDDFNEKKSGNLIVECLEVLYQ